MSGPVDSEALKKDGGLIRPVTDRAQGGDSSAFLTEEALLRLEEALRGALHWQRSPSTVAPSQETPPPPMQEGRRFSEQDAARPRAPDNGFAVDRAGAHQQRRNGSLGEREPRGEIVAVAGDQPHAHGDPPRHNGKAVVFELVEQALGKVEKRIADWLIVSTQIEAIGENLPLAPGAEESISSSLRRWEDLRGLLGRVLNEVEDLHPELREAIKRALAS
jgi:hypothetical protein